MGYGVGVGVGVGVALGWVTCRSHTASSSVATGGRIESHGGTLHTRTRAAPPPRTGCAFGARASTEGGDAVRRTDAPVASRRRRRERRRGARVGCARPRTRRSRSTGPRPLFGQGDRRAWVLSYPVRAPKKGRAVTDARATRPLLSPSPYLRRFFVGGGGRGGAGTVTVPREVPLPEERTAMRDSRFTLRRSASRRRE